MRKNILKIFIISMLCGYTELLAYCYGVEPCRGGEAMSMMANLVAADFEILDKTLAEETIKNITNKIKKSHNELEKDSKTILENTRKLNKEYYIIEQDILHNQILINELQSLLTDTIASSAEAKKSKNTLEMLKKATK
jgi:hypothetical protein